MQQEFERQVTPDTYEMFVHPLRPVAANGAFTVQATNPRQAEWWQHRYRKVGDRVAQGYGFTGLVVLYPSDPL